MYVRMFFLFYISIFQHLKFLQFFSEDENCKNQFITIITKINYLLHLFITNYYTYW